MEILSDIFSIALFFSLQAAIRKLASSCSSQQLATIDASDLIEPRLLDSFLAFSSRRESFVWGQPMSFFLINQLNVLFFSYKSMKCFFSYKSMKCWRLWWKLEWNHNFAGMQNYDLLWCRFTAKYSICSIERTFYALKNNFLNLFPI